MLQSDPETVAGGKLAGEKCDRRGGGRAAGGGEAPPAGGRFPGGVPRDLAGYGAIKKIHRTPHSTVPQEKKAKRAKKRTPAARAPFAKAAPRRRLLGGRRGGASAHVVGAHRRGPRAHVTAHRATGTHVGAGGRGGLGGGGGGGGRRSRLLRGLLLLAADQAQQADQQARQGQVNERLLHDGLSPF